MIWVRIPVGSLSFPVPSTSQPPWGTFWGTAKQKNPPLLQVPGFSVSSPYPFLFCWYETTGLLQGQNIAYSFTNNLAKMPSPEVTWQMYSPLVKPEMLTCDSVPPAG